MGLSSYVKIMLFEGCHNVVQVLAQNEYLVTAQLYVCMRVCMCACMHACVRECVHSCVHVRGYLVLSLALWAHQLG